MPTVVFQRFDGGVNRDLVPSRLPENTLASLTNAILRRGSIESRPCFVRRVALPSPLTQVALFHRAVLPTGEHFFLGYHDGTNWKLAVWRPNESGWTTLATLSGKPLSAVTYKGWVFLATENAMLKTNGSVVYNWGITPPTTAPSAAAGTAGNLSGTYMWKVTFARQEGTYLIESNSSPASSPLTLSNQRAVLTIPTSPDPQVNRRRIYRTGGTRSDWKLVGELLDNTTTSFTDNVPDSDLTLQESLRDYKDRPPVGSLIAVHRERVFVVEAARPTKLWFSTYGEPEYFPPTPPADDPFSGSWVEIGQLDGQPITALAPVGTALAIFKSQSIYLFLGDLLNEIAVRRVTSYGAPHARAVVSAGEVFFHDGWHLYRFTGDAITNLSLHRFSSLFRTTSPDAIDLVFDPLEGVLWIVVKTGSVAGLHRFDLVSNIYEGAWTIPATIHFALPDDPSKARGLWVLSNNGIVQPDSNATTDWDGNPVSWTVQFPDIVEPKEFLKRVTAFALTGNLPSTVQWNITAKVTWSSSATGPAAALRRYAPDNLIDTNVRIQVTGVGNGRIDEAILDIQPLRRVSV